jgi:hypothetical protein
MLNQSKKVNTTDLVIKLFPFLLLALSPVMVYVLLKYFSEKMLLLAAAGMAGLLFTFLFIFCLPLRVKRRIEYLSVLGILVILPFQNSLNLLIGFSIRAPILGLWAFFFMDTLLTQFASRREQTWKLCLFEAMALLLTFWAIIYLPVAAWAGSIFGGVYGFIVQFQGILAYFVIRSLSLTEKQIRKLLAVMLVSLVIMVGYGFYEFMWAQYKHIDWLVAHSRHPFVQDLGSLAGRAYYRQQWVAGASYRSQSFELEFVSFGYSGYVLSSVLLAVVVLGRRWRKSRRMRIALGLAVLGLGSSVTLSAIGIFFLSFWIVGWEAFRRRGNAKYAWILLPTLAMAGIIVAWAIFPHIFVPIQERLAGLSLADRHQIHTRGNLVLLERVLPFVLMGRGTGTSGPGALKFFPSEEFPTYFTENEYLGNIAEWGLPGLLVYLLFMFSLARHIIRLKRRYRWGSLGYALGVGLFCVTIGYSLIGFYHNVWGQSSIDVQFMTLLALWTQGSTLFDDGGPGVQRLAEEGLSANA